MCMYLCVPVCVPAYMLVSARTHVYKCVFVCASMCAQASVVCVCGAEEMVKPSRVLRGLPGYRSFSMSPASCLEKMALVS